MTKMTPQEARGPQNGSEPRIAIKPQQKCMSRAHFAHVFEPQSFFKNDVRKNDFESRPCAKYGTFGAHVWVSQGFYSGFWKHYKTAARNSKWPFRAQNFEFQWAFTMVFEARMQKSTIKLQTFGLECGKRRSTRENKWFGAHMRPPLQWEHTFWQKKYRKPRAAGWSRHKPWKT